MSAFVLLCFVVMTASNALTSMGYFGPDNKKLSDENPTYVSPDGLTFAIWGAIYLSEACLVFVQLFPGSHEEIFTRRCQVLNLDVRQRLVIAFLTNAMWLPIFTARKWWPSQLVITVYLAALVSLYVDVNVRSVRGAYEQVFVAMPISLNLSWIVVATFLGLTVCARNSGWVDAHGVGGSVSWAFAICAFVTLAGIACACAGDVAYAFVAGWALRGIYRMQTVEDPVRFPPTAMNAQLAAVAYWASAAIWTAASIAFLANSVQALRPAPKVPLSQAGASLPEAPSAGPAMIA
jgi:hypothetical protein